MQLEYYIFGEHMHLQYNLLAREKELSKILVAIDGSEASIRAANFAFDIAARSNGRCTIYLVHIIPSQVLMAHSSGFFGAVLTDYRKEIEQEADRWFKKISAKVRGSDRVHIIQKVISTGDSIVAEIVDYADRKRIELILVGATGKSGLRRLLLGSVSASLVTHSHCSVMVVR
jgi:nucleotide-binding universal stress UspA family protein